MGGALLLDLTLSSSLASQYIVHDEVLYQSDPLYGFTDPRSPTTILVLKMSAALIFCLYKAAL